MFQPVTWKNKMDYYIIKTISLCFAKRPLQFLEINVRATDILWVHSTDVIIIFLQPSNSFTILIKFCSVDGILGYCMDCFNVTV